MRYTATTPEGRKKEREILRRAMDAGEITSEEVQSGAVYVEGGEIVRADGEQGGKDAKKQSGRTSGRKASETAKRTGALEHVQGEEIAPDDGEDMERYYIRECMRLYQQYFAERGIDISGTKFTKIPQAVYQDGFAYIYDHLFRAARRDKHRPASTVDHSNVSQLNAVMAAYERIVQRYGIKAQQSFFCTMTGISRETIAQWRNGETRAYVYYTPDGRVIEDLGAYKIHHAGEEIRKEPSTLHVDFVKKLDTIYREAGENALNDTPLGITVNANNSPRMGLQYNKQSMIDQARVSRVLEIGQLPRFALDADNAGLLEGSES